MNFEAFFQSLGLGDIIERDVVAVQLLVLGATAGFFAISLAMMVMAARSAGAARRSRAEAENFLRSAQDIVVEARQLSAQFERAAARSASAGDAPHPIRVGSRETTPEADIEVIDRNLDAAKESATVPKGLWRKKK